MKLDCPDVWRSRGLGLNARPVLGALERRVYPSASELARTVGLTPETTRRVLQRLVPYGLAVKTPLGWARGPADLAAVAPLLRTYGAGERQRRQHQLEREMYCHSQAAGPKRLRMVDVPRNRVEVAPHSDRANLDSANWVGGPDTRYVFQERLAICLDSGVPLTTAGAIALRETERWMTLCSDGEPGMREL